MDNPLYSYSPRGTQWAVLKWQYLPTGQSATTMVYYPTKETARKVANNLNIANLKFITDSEIH